jgi:hypothetical protein
MPVFFESVESRLLLSAVPVAAHPWPAGPAAIIASARPAVSHRRADIQKLLTDLAAIKAHSGITAAQLAALKSDITQIAAVASKPNAILVQKLIADAKADAAAGHRLTTAQKMQLGADALAVLESAGVPTGLAVQTVADLGSVVSAAHVTPAEVELIIADLQAIASTF